MPVRLPHASALALALALCAGCGGGARTDARSVSERFLRALGEHDGAAACATLSQQTLSRLEDDEGKPCADAIGSLGLQPSAVRRIEVYMINAKADLADGDSLFLSNGQDGWRLDAVGCKRQGGKPADQPYDCALEA
jgi:hypothetical protein